MSCVTNLIVSWGITDNGMPLEMVNSYFEGGGLVSVDSPKLPSGWYGGSKFLETPLFIGAFNYFNTGAFVEHLRTLPWKRPHEVQVIVKEQHEEIFHIIHITDGWVPA